MRCSSVRFKIDEYLEGGLSIKTRNEMKRHLSQCNECREYMNISQEILKIAPVIHSAESTPDWNKVSSEFAKIALEKKTANANEGLGAFLKFKTVFMSIKLTPLFSAISAVVIFGLLINTFILFVSSSDLIADESDCFLMEQIKGAESIYKANIKSLKEDFVSIEDYLPVETLRAINQESENLDKTIKECSRLAMIQPSNQLLVRKLFESYKMQVNMHKNLLINIKTQEV
jgi:hypothetical protein